MNPPKFKVGDMVQVHSAGLPVKQEHQHLLNKVFVITGLEWEAEYNAYCYFDDENWRYEEMYLRLIKDGDLKLDDIPLDAKEPA